MYYRKIDGLRCLAIFFVLIEHILLFDVGHGSFGYFGVDLFFVISGFLITQILLRPDLVSWNGYLKFLGRRTLRIFPVYYLSLGILLLFNVTYVKEHLFSLVTYTFNYEYAQDGFENSVVSHFWSLGVEEQFYLLWPLVIFQVRRYKEVLLILIVVLISFGFLQMMFNIIPSMVTYNFVGLPTRMASLATGALGAILAKWYNLPKKFFTNRIAELVIFGLLVLCLYVDFSLKYPIFAFCSLYMVLKAAYFEFRIQWVNTILSHKLVVKIGLMSYGIYVYHKPLASFLQNHVFNPFWSKIDFSTWGYFSIFQWHSWIVKVPLFLIVMYFMAQVSFNYFEKPLLTLKDRFFNYA